MGDKMKLTELTKEDLRSVSGGMTVWAKCADKCGCTVQQSFGEESSQKSGGISKPIKPITK